MSIYTLTGPWFLAPDPDNRGRENRWFSAIQPDACEAPVPGMIQQALPGYHGVAWYWHVFRLPEPPHTRLLLHFGAVDYQAEVWVNGCPVGGYEGGETPFEVDITGAGISGDNLLAIRVLNPTMESIDGFTLGQIPHRNKTIPPRCGAFFNCGGILYPVELHVVPEVRVADLFVRPDPATGRIEATVTVRNNGDVPLIAALDLRVEPAAGGGTLDSMRLEDVQFPPGDSTHELAVTPEQFRLWNLDDPCLYRVTASLGAHDLSVRCGYRDFRVIDGYFYLNGKRLFLKSTHTGNHTPIGMQLPVLPDHLRRDIINAKAAGFNCVRFIAGVAWPEQLDFCDEIGIMAYEECYASWCLEDSPQMSDRFIRSTAGMILRDRNHPSVTIWGLLNETSDGPVFRQAVEFLPALRELDPTRLVLLGSGRWDCQWGIGSLSNPGGTEWECQWGAEEPGAPPVSNAWDTRHGGYFKHAGDAHVYPGVPQTVETSAFLRTLGADTKPVFLSEYGIGSLMNVIREWRHFEQAGARPDLEDAAMLRVQAEALQADWTRLGFDDVYLFPEDMLRESQRLHARQRTLGFDCIRANPRLVGFNLTGILDHAITGEGLWTFWREWKPATFDAVCDGWAPLRWCLFTEPSHGYNGREFTVEAVLANEDVLPPGDYPATFRILGPAGLAWEAQREIHVTGAFADSALCEKVRIDGPAGRYTFAANLDRGGAPSGGRLAFHLSCADALPEIFSRVTTWGMDEKAACWLNAHAIECTPFTVSHPHHEREILLVGLPPEEEHTAVAWQQVIERIRHGAVAVFLNPRVFKHGDDSTARLPLSQRGSLVTFPDWLYHKECVSRRHPVFAGLLGPGILDWDYYGPVIPKEIFADLDTPDEIIAAAFATGHNHYPTGYGCGLLMAAYRLGAGAIFLNTLHLLENLQAHPAADRLVLNLVEHAARTWRLIGNELEYAARPDHAG